MSKTDLVKELNGRLKKERLDLPEFRMSVTKSGKNVAWLCKHITTKNPKVHPRILELLSILNGA